MIKSRRKRKLIKTSGREKGTGFWALLLIWWSFVFIGFITTVEPIRVRDFIIPNGYVMFYGMVFLIIWLMMILIRKQILKSLIWSIGICFGLYLYRYGLASLLNVLLLLCLFMIFEGLTIKPKVKEED